MQNHFNKLHLASCAPRFARSLETKWGIIKHDVGKFVGHHTIMLALCESGIGTEDALQKAFDLYETKHPKHQTFIFTYAWYVLKEIPWQVNLREETKETSLVMKRKANFGDSTNFDNNGV